MAFPEATIKWYHNDTLMEEVAEKVGEHVISVIEINNMSLDKVGVYTCDVTNTVESYRFSADVTITGIGMKLCYLTSRFSNTYLQSN